MKNYIKNFLKKNSKTIKNTKIILFITIISSISSIIYANSINRDRELNWLNNMDTSYSERFERILSKWVNVLLDKATWLKWEEYPNLYSSAYKQSYADYCSNKGDNFRTPTVHELRTLISLNKVNRDNAFSIHPQIKRWYYITSTIYNRFPTSSRWYVNFSNSDIRWQDHDIMGQYVICIHD